MRRHDRSLLYLKLRFFLFLKNNEKNNDIKMLNIIINKNQQKQQKQQKPKQKIQTKMNFEFATGIGASPSTNTILTTSLPTTHRVENEF